MPLDKSGKFHMNTQRAMAADKMPPMKPKSPTGKEPMGKEPPMHEGGEHEPGSIAAHLSEMHAEHGGQHMHVHQGEDGAITTHHVGHDGKVEGPHEHPDMETVKDHMDAVMGEHEPAPAMAGMHDDGGMDGY